MSVDFAEIFGSEHEDVDGDKRTKIEMEKKELEEAISAGNYRTKKDKVAAILNLFPTTRNSDVALTIKYWEMFQDNIYTGDNIDPIKLFELERLTTVARLRAKIQNEYGLYLAEEHIRKRRRKLEESVRDVMTCDNPSLPIVNIYADETGKTTDIVIIGSIWFIEGISTFKLFKKVMEWKDSNKWTKEIHFTRIGKSDAIKIKSFVDLLSENREYIGFKFIAFDKRGSSRSIEETVVKLYSLLIIKGIKHELESGRISLPRNISLQIDKEDSLDAVALEELKQNIANQMSLDYGNRANMNKIEAVDSKESPYVQVADLISGAINRKLNHVGDIGYKDELAEYILNKLHINLEHSEDYGLDSSVLIML